MLSCFFKKKNRIEYERWDDIFDKLPDSIRNEWIYSGHTSKNISFKCYRVKFNDGIPVYQVRKKEHIDPYYGLLPQHLKPVSFFWQTIEKDFLPIHLTWENVNIPEVGYWILPEVLKC